MPRAHSTVAHATQLLRRAIDATGGNARRFAHLLGVNERTVRSWLAQDPLPPVTVQLLCLVVVRDPEPWRAALEDVVFPYVSPVILVAGLLGGEEQQPA